MKTIEFLQSKNMLSEGKEKFIISGEFGVICLNDLLDEYAAQFKPSLVSEGEINKMQQANEVNILLNNSLREKVDAQQAMLNNMSDVLEAVANYQNNKFTAYQIQRMATKNLMDFKQGLQYNNKSDNSCNEDMAVGFANWIRDNKWSPGNHYQNGSMWYHNFKPTSTTKDLFKEYLNSINKGE